MYTGTQPGGVSALEPAWTPGRGGAGKVRPVTTPWSFKLLALFLLLLYANLPLVFPQAAAFAPAQVVSLGALALLFVERSVTRTPFAFSWPESHLLLVFLGVAALSSFTSLWMRHAVEETVTLLKFLAIYFLIVNTVESWRRLRTLFVVMATAAVIPAVGALKHAAQGVYVEGNRTGWVGIFANPNDLAYSLVLVFPISLAVALGARGWWKLPAWGAVAVQAVAVFSTYSRGGFLGFAAVLLLCFLFWSRPGTRLPGLIVAAALLAFTVTSLWDRDEGFTDLLADATLQQRVTTVRVGLAMFADHPLVGVGLGSSVIGWPLYAPSSAVGEGWLHTHNTYIQVLSETGILGAAAFFLAFGIGLLRAHRLARAWRRVGHRERFRAVSALEIGILGLAVCGLSGGYALSWFPYLLLGLVSAAVLLPLPDQEWDREREDEEAEDDGEISLPTAAEGSTR